MRPALRADGLVLAACAVLVVLFVLSIAFVALRAKRRADAKLLPPIYAAPYLGGRIVAVRKSIV